MPSTRDHCSDRRLQQPAAGPLGAWDGPRESASAGVALELCRVERSEKIRTSPMIRSIILCPRVSGGPCEGFDCTKRCRPTVDL